MLNALYDLGQVLQKVNPQNAHDIVLENPASSENYRHVIVINFNADYTYQDVTLEDFMREDPRKYLYKRASGSRGTDFSPTSRVSYENNKSSKDKLVKTFNNKLLRWFKNHRNGNDALNRLYEEIIRHKDEILRKLKDYDDKLKKGKILTIKIGGKYLYEIEQPDFRPILWHDLIKKLKNVKTEDQVCSICGREKPEVFTTSLIYRFYTFDKRSFIASGFNRKYAWKNFPICMDCYLTVEYGKKYVEENLRFRFYGKNYYLIPKILLDNREVIEEIQDILSMQDKAITLKNQVKNRITDDEREILDVLKEHKDYICFYLLFLQRKNAAERILLLIEDVLPSRLSEIFAAKSEVDKKFKADEKSKLEYNFGCLVYFLNEFENLFFEVVDKIFRGGELDAKTLLQIFNKKIRSEFLGNATSTSKNKNKSHGNNLSYIFTIRKALMNLCFFEELNLINTGGQAMANSQFEEVYAKAGKALNTPAKRGIFLLGALTQLMLNVQYALRKSTPFQKYLKGLKMNEEDIRGLLPKLHNKFMEYQKLDKGKKAIEEEIVKNLLAEEHFRLSVDEINFYFAAGMALAQEVANAVYGGNPPSEAKIDIDEEEAEMVDELDTTE